MANAKATQFISALVKNLQAVCHGHVDFDQNIKVVGHLFLTVDSSTEFNYILNEKVCKNDQSSTTFVSRSFYATDPQPKAPMKSEPSDNRLSSDQRANWQHQQYEAKSFDQRQKVTQLQSAPLMHESHPQSATSAQNRTLQKRSPKDNISPQPFAKVPRLSDKDLHVKRCVPHPHVMYNQSVYDFESNQDSRHSFSDGATSSQMGADSADEDVYDGNLHYAEMPPHQLPPKNTANVTNPVKSEPDHHSQDTKSIKPKATQPHSNIPSSVTTSKAIGGPSSTHTPSSSNKQVIDVDLTKVKEEPQDDGFIDAEKATAYAEAEQAVAFAESQEWSQGQQDDYGEEEYGEEYGGDSNDDEYLTDLRDNAIGLYPIGVINPNPNPNSNDGKASSSQASMMGAASNQQFVNNQMPMMRTLQGPGQAVPSSSGMGGKKNMPKIPCNYCGKVFSGETTLNRHVQSQHLQIRVRCPICFVTFARKDGLNKHMLKKHSAGGAPVEVSCPICEEAFTNQDQVHKHIFEVHRVNPPIS